MTHGEIPVRSLSPLQVAGLALLLRSDLDSNSSFPFADRTPAVFIQSFLYLVESYVSICQRTSLDVLTV